ncbi:MAG TPA: hypothetical protein VIL86_00650 [Tepidisphaeraceae bacterium]|jgi:hypothetical protein
MELEQSSNPDFVPQVDRRPRMTQPPPVNLIAVNDLRAAAPAGTERELDVFYVELLEFEKEAVETPTYIAENFRIIFDIHEGLVERGDYRPIGIIVQSVAAMEGKLIEREIPFTRTKGLVAGEERIALVDPGGNWVELTEARQVG